jgi:protein transport protein SEC61 subunit gamma and related proteins
MEDYKETRMQKIKRFIKECKRVLKVTKKPDSVEFKTIVKVSGLGIIAIGLIGFLIQMIRVLLFG